MSIFVSSAVAASHSNFLLESNVPLLLKSIVAPLYSRRPQTATVIIVGEMLP